MGRPTTAREGVAILVIAIVVSISALIFAARGLATAFVRLPVHFLASLFSNADLFFYLGTENVSLNGEIRWYLISVFS